ncbi:MAG: hypothetical protein ABI960_07615 [Candidatus Eisenbacteria bacterium]
MPRRGHSIDRTDAAGARRDLARAAAALARVPSASVRFERGARGSVDATYGLDGRGDMAAAEAFSRIAMLHVDPLVIHDSTRSMGLPPELAPERTRLRWFGSLPVQTREGAVVGVVCVFDRDPQPEEGARLDEVANLVHGLDVVGAVLGPTRARRVRANAAPTGARALDRESLEADLMAEVGILRERIETLGRTAQRRDPETDERAARAWLAVELEALRRVADRANALATRLVRVSGEESRAA